MWLRIAVVTRPVRWEVAEGGSRARPSIGRGKIALGIPSAVMTSQEGNEVTWASEVEAVKEKRQDEAKVLKKTEWSSERPKDTYIPTNKKCVDTEENNS